ncbi:MAG: aconitate hydratase AcnA [Eggerthellaceae bacterium]|nr:aconitate hydratase AcnA [Eggerthellaceae bacterium]
MSDVATSILEVGESKYEYYPVSECEGVEKLPYSLTVLLENVLRNARTPEEAQTYAQRIIEAGLAGKAGDEVEFAPARVLFQDFTGVPVFVDFAVMRDACVALGGDPAKINPQVPCDLVIDHSVIADEFGCEGARQANMKLEFARNRERYSFLKWAQDSFENVRIVPPGQGICHQLNIENFASVVMGHSALPPLTHYDQNGSKGAGQSDPLPLAYFDTLVGTDSHTPTANGIGVLGWGVGGIEAEAAALGQPITTLVPPVVGVKLTGELRGGVAAMDVALTFAQRLREKGVVGKFVECFGPGVANLSATQRACISNMTPEYGSTCTLFPVDGQTLDFLRMTGRGDAQVALVEAYAKAQGLWREDGDERVYSEVVEIDLGEIAHSMSGPSRPHDRFDIADCKDRFHGICADRNVEASAKAQVNLQGEACELTHGAIAIAAVTSCTTATDPRMMLQCGLLAKKAAEAGLRPKPWVKTVFAPGSHATELLLQRAGLLEGLQELNFATCGFGCMSCIGNSGPILPEMHDICGDIELASVLSGNRNFEGRISPDVAQNYLMTPAAVVAFSLVGTVDFDMENDALGQDADGHDVFLRDIWPDQEEVEALMPLVDADLYAQGAVGLYDGDEAWQALSVEKSDLFAWDDDSTYVRRAPYFDGMGRDPEPPAAIEGARVLALLGDFITTDHISPAGAFAAETPAGRYLQEHGVKPEDFNTYGSRRGNHEVMMRGTFANVKLANQLAEGRKGGWTRDFTTDEVSWLFDAATHYEADGTPVIVVAGKMYGSGSSRDWAAKGPMLLGVRAALAESFERIHRSNLIGMGILPLQFQDGENAETLGLDGTEQYAIKRTGQQSAEVTATRADGTATTFPAIVRIDTPTEDEYYAHGGILQYVLRSLI